MREVSRGFRPGRVKSNGLLENVFLHSGQVRRGTDDRFVSSVTQGLRPAKFHEKVGALHLKPTFWQILGRHMFSMSYTGFSTLSSSRAFAKHDRPLKAMSR